MPANTIPQPISIGTHGFMVISHELTALDTKSAPMETIPNWKKSADRSDSVVTSAIMVQIMANATTGPPPTSQARHDSQTARRGKMSENHVTVRMMIV
jgi:hypothetical protein